jgi:hypothetical protein
LVAGIDIGGVLSSYGAQNTINHTLCNQLHWHRSRRGSRCRYSCWVSFS